MSSTKEVQKRLPSPHSARLYLVSFATGYTAGIAGESVTLLQKGQFNTEGFSSPAFRDGAVISGVQQVAKDFSKAELKRYPLFNRLSKENPFLFGASVGVPMWALTRLFATPLQNSRKDESKVFKGCATSIRNDIVYQSVKTGLDEYCAAYVFPQVLPRIDSPVTRKLVEGSIAGFIGSVTHVLTYPYKTLVTGQTLPQAYSTCLTAFPKVTTKKIVFTLARPHIAKALLPPPAK